MKLIILSILIFLSGAAMAYNLHIERHDCCKSEDSEISENEWISYCTSASDLRIEREISAINPSTGERVSFPGIFCYWTDQNGNEHTFSYSSGRITFSGEDVEIPKAKEIANDLGAVVVGDEGEEY